MLALHLPMQLVDVVVKLISGGKHHHSHEHEHDHEIEVVAEEEANEEQQQEEEEEVRVMNCPCCSEDPVGDLATLQRQADEIMAHDHHGHDHGCSHEHNDNNNSNNNNDSIETGLAGNTKPGSEEKRHHGHDPEKDKLIKMGINTAIAIGLHNFPEGLATFVSALDDPKVGAVLAVAIGIHNIPEGLCVALPIYYATGNRWKAFGWALVSGASEPFAALLGWAVLANSFSNVMYAILFGGVAGMMVIISTRELLPTAHRYDPEDTVVTFSFIAGMFIMALSLVLFVL
jgi:zinc transporter ZupT